MLIRDMNEKHFHDARKMELVFKLPQTGRLYKIQIIIYAFCKIKSIILPVQSYSCVTWHHVLRAFMN
jgi:hypothetical protein